MEMIWSLLAGGIFALGDGWLLYWVMRKAASQPDRAKNWLLRGMSARALLTAAVIWIYLCLPFFNAAGIVIALLLQKAFLIAAVLLRHKKENH